jgi:hypothetical protein
MAREGLAQKRSFLSARVSERTTPASLRREAEGLKEQAAQIQKVSAQLEMITPAPRVVENQ